MPDTVRAAIARALHSSDKSMSWLSLQLGRNHAYIQQYIERGSPRDLKHEHKLQIAKLLGMNLAELGFSEADIRQLRGRSSEAEAGDDVEPYLPPRGSLLVTLPSVKYKRVISNVLERHPLRISRGDILAFDMSPASALSLRSEQIVLVEISERGKGSDVRTLIREFVRPGLLVTNRETENEAISITDKSLIWDVRIVGVFRTMSRDPEQ